MDLKAALKIHPNDQRRVIRALEICITKNMPISHLQKERQGLWGKYDICLFALNRERQELYARIGKRVEQMFDDGIIDEVKGIEEERWGKTAQKIIGVQEIQGFLRGEYDLNEAKGKNKIKYKTFSKAPTNMV